MRPQPEESRIGPHKAGETPARATNGENKPVGRIGITVTKKIGCAVIRNRCKRLVREAFRHDPSWLPEGIDVVVIVRQGTAELKRDAVIQEWRAVRSHVDRVVRKLNAR